MKKLFIIGLFTMVAINISWAKATQSKKPQMPPTIISAVKTQQKFWQLKIQSNASLSAFEGTQVSPEIAGRVIKIFFKSGDYVPEGAPILLIYPDIIKAQLKKAEALYQLSKINYGRFLKLYKKQFYSKADLDKAKAGLKGNLADVNQLKAQLIQTVVMAPFAGKLGLRKVSIGDYLSPGQAIVSLQSLDPIRVDFTIPEVYLPELKIGSRIELKSPAASKVYAGKIYAFDSMIDPNTRMLGARAKIENPNHKLLPGTFGVATIYLGKPQPTVVIPQTAVVYSPNGNYVYRMMNHKAVKTPVTLGLKLDNNLMIIKKGLTVKDFVITAGQMKLRDGAPVMTPAEAQQMFAKKARG